jgi:hypothetical protein
MRPTEPDMTAGNLLATFPGMTINNGLRSEDLSFWAAHLRIGMGLTSLEGFLTSLLGGFLPVAARTGVTVALLPEPAGIRVRIGGVVPLSATDPRPFSLNQTYTFESAVLTIHVETVVAPSSGRQFVRRCLLAHAEQLNAHRLTLTASGIGGSQEGVFVWARYGFVPTAGDWNAMRRWGLRTLGQDEAALPALRDAVHAILMDPEPVSLRRLVHLSWLAQDRVAAKNFLDGLLSSNVSWKGRLDLTDDADANWIRAYADTAPVERFQPLLPAPSGQSVAPPGLVPEPEPEAPGYAGSGYDEPELVELLAARIAEKEGTIEDVKEEYPGLVAKVQAALDRQRTQT